MREATVPLGVAALGLGLLGLRTRSSSGAADTG